MHMSMTGTRQMPGTMKQHTVKPGSGTITVMQGSGLGSCTAMKPRPLKTVIRCPNRSHPGKGQHGSGTLWMSGCDHTRTTIATGKRWQKCACRILFTPDVPGEDANISPGRCPPHPKPHPLPLFGLRNIAVYDLIHSRWRSVSYSGPVPHFSEL